jgi:hypothetical protein
VQLADKGVSVSASSIISVADASLQVISQNLVATEGQAVSNVLVATLTDGDARATAGDYTATVAWGDGDGSSAVSVVADGHVAGQFDVLASRTHPYAEEGNLTVTVMVRDGGGSTATALSPVAVGDTLVSAAGAVRVTATEAAPFAGVVATFTDGAPAGAAADYTAVIAWGDGSSSTGTVAATAGGFQVLGSHSYAEDGSYAVSVSVLDSDGNSTTAGGTATVGDAALSALSKTLAFTEGAAATQVAASFEDADPRGFASDYSATIAWGDGTTSVGTLAANGAGFDVLGSHSYAEEGSYAVSVTIQDAGGASVTANSTAGVADAPLAAGGVPRFSATGGVPFTHLLATFSDADPAGAVGDYTASINWGDGTSSSGTIGTGTGNFTVTGTHTYPPGSGNNYTVTVTIGDSGGSTAVVTDSIHDPTPNQVVVIQLYQALLGREAEAGGLAYWGGVLDSGAATRAQVARLIESSPEYRADAVQSLYQEFLHRAADPTGLQYFVQYLGQGGTVEGVATVIVASPEYYLVRGGTTAGFLVALYHDALGRAPDATGQAAFAQALAQGATRGQVAAAVFASLEYEQDLIEGYYQRFLNRPADTLGLLSFVNALRQGAGDEDIVAAILGSAEYFTNVL